MHQGVADRAALASAWSAQIQTVRARHARRTRRSPAGAPVTDLSHIYVLEVPGETDVTALAHRYQQDPHVEYATPNYVASVSFVPSDPLYGQLWGLQKIQMESAWDTARGTGVLAAVIDTGIDYTHPDLAANVWVNPGEVPGNGLDDDANGCIDDVHGCDFAYADGDPMDIQSHGTHVAGTIGAIANTQGVIGVAPEATLMAAKGLNDFGSGTFADLAAAINYAALNGADILNNSWGCAFGCLPDPTMQAAIQNAYNLGAVIVFAAGNDNDNVDDNFPQNLPETIVVSAFTQTDQKAGFSNYGSRLDVAAPGVAILSTLPGLSYGQLSGTSMACPHVVGVGALLIQLHPNWTIEEIREALRESADDVGPPGVDLESGHGRINAAQAVIFVPENDPIPPAAVTDLTVQSEGLGSVRLHWTATGDDGLVGTATTYRIRYAQSPIIDDATFDAATAAAGVPAPQPSGSPETVVITGLSPAVTYFFAIKVVDNKQNLSALSNVPSGTGGDGIVALSEDFESGAPGWSAIGLWHLSTARANSPSTSQAYNDGVDYDTGVANSGTLTSPPIDLTAAVSQALLSFAHWYETERFFTPYDIRQVQVSTNGGLSWATLQQWDSTMPNQPTWATASIDLSAYIGGTVRLRFFFDTVDSIANTFEGWYVDDVVVLVDEPQVVNEAPVLDPIGNRFGIEGQLLTFGVSATDPDGDALSYSATNLPPGATFTGQTFSWTPDFNQAGTFSMTLTVSDGLAQDAETIQIAVTDVALQITKLSDSTDPFSPNGDGRKETTKFTGTFNHSASWQLEGRNASGTGVRHFAGAGTTLSIVWDGTDDAGAGVPDGTYTYLLSGTDVGGSSAQKSRTVAIDTGAPAFSGLSDAPDPFRPSTGQTTTISWTMSEKAKVTLKVYTSTGSSVRTLMSSTKSAGALSAVWDGRNASGVLMAPGVYTYKLSIEDPAGNRASPYPAVGTVTVQ